MISSKNKTLLYLQQEVKDEAQKWMLFLFVFLFVILHILLLLFSPLLLSFRRRLETRGEPRSKLDDILHSRFTPVDDHGVLQVVDELLVEQRLVLLLKDRMTSY